jgi:hypothetical protein
VTTNDGAADLVLNKAGAVAGLTPAARVLHRLLLETFAGTGRAPTRSDLERKARDGVAALSELVERDVVALDDQGEIRAAYPFSPSPTRHRVTWEGGMGVYAMCAIDALGMSAMLGIPVTIASTEPGTGRAMTVEVDDETARWQPESAVVFAGDTGGACCPSVDRTCDHINFFTSPEAAHEWAANNPGVNGVVLDQEQALACGVAEFGSLLRPRES